MMNLYCKIITILLVLPLLFSTAFIFSNSLKNSEESHEDSDPIVEIVEELAEKMIPDNSWDWNYIVRKSAHFFEFFMLGIFTILLFLSLKWKKRVIYAFLYVIWVACTDELIQWFTGRTSCFTDVMIDVSGASVGIVLILLLYLWMNRHFHCA